MPSLIHQADSAVSPDTPVEANGAPLSERIVSGKPNSRKARSNRGWASSWRVLAVADTLIR
jgi:hypothetical protein